ncbi:hypothetical protein KFE94_00830 [bacterium SCSIO 12643]|nr:hypothetical protein KFE94_00830 [bacterium SCSIO 12643]
MKYFLLILALSVSSFLTAKKARIPFEILTLEADEIVVGEIVEVNNSSFVIEIRNDIKREEQRNKKLTLNFWKEWQCDYHRFKYEKGVSALFFLRKDVKSESYNVLHGSSGELKIENDSVSIKSFGKIDLATVITSSQFLMNCFDYIGDYWFQSYEGASCYLKPKCPKNGINKFWNLNEFNSWIYASISEGSLLEERWFYELDHKDPVSVIRGLQYAAKTKDYDFLSLLVDPKFDNDDNVDLLDFFDEDDQESIRLLKKFNCSYDIIEVSIGKHYCVYELRYSQKTICHIILVKRYSNWYFEEMRF